MKRRWVKTRGQNSFSFAFSAHGGSGYIPPSPYRDSHEGGRGKDRAHRGSGRNFLRGMVLSTTKNISINMFEGNTIVWGPGRSLETVFDAGL